MEVWVEVWVLKVAALTLIFKIMMWSSKLTSDPSRNGSRVRGQVRKSRRIPHGAEGVDDEDAALQLPHALLLHGHLAAVHVQGLPVELRQEQGSPSTGSCAVPRHGTFGSLHGLALQPPPPRSAGGGLHPHTAAAVDAAGAGAVKGNLAAWTSRLGQEAVFHQGC